MQELTKIKLETWAESINWAVPTHPSDIRKFYDFIIEAYKQGDQSLTEEEFSEGVAR
jgi:hypothetical protein